MDNLYDGSGNLFNRRLWDWAPYNDCFDRGIRISDIDGVVENNCHFLFIEGKPPGILLPKGQYLLHSRLPRARSIISVVLRGYPPREVVGWDIVDGGDFNGDINGFKQFLRDWYLKTSRR